MSHRLVRADFNGLFGDLLCISHTDTCRADDGTEIRLETGMQLTAFEDNVDEDGRRDNLLASGTVEPSPDWLTCNGSRWVLRLDQRGVRHESEVEPSPE
jgi:hypothetical protein